MKFRVIRDIEPLCHVCVSMPRTAIVRKTVIIGRCGDTDDSGHNAFDAHQFTAVHNVSYTPNEIVYLLIPTLFDRVYI